MKKKWYQQKTTWAGIGGALSGEISSMVAINSGISALALIFLRQGVEGKR